MRKSSLIFLSSVLLQTLIAGCGQRNKSSEATSIGENMNIEYTSQTDSAAVEMAEEYDGPQMSESEGRNIHIAVDLGLPSGVKWATTNVGAVNPWDFGEYYAMGEIKPSRKYDHMSNKNLLTIPDDEKVVLQGNPKYDAATANWGENWRLPTDKEFYELRTECAWEWTNEGGNNGHRVTGPNGRSIFFPAAGYKSNDPNATTVAKNVDGHYWIAPHMPVWAKTNLYGNRQHTDKFSYYFITDNGCILSQETAYYEGNSIRPVTTSTYEELGIDETRIEDYIPKVNRIRGQATGSIGGHEYVDLGLPSGVKWATVNVGAKTGMDCGDTYEWGATFCGEVFDSTDGSTLGYDELVKNISGDINYDVATKLWGESWRLPTVKEMDELIAKCVWTIQSENKKAYYLVTGPNKNSIIIPIGDTGLWSSVPKSSTMAYGMRLRGGVHNGMMSGIIVEDRQKTQAHVRPVSN